MERKRKPLTQLDRFLTDKRRRSTSTSSSCSVNDQDEKPGTILHMVLKNFMCHSHLEVDFKNNINFISGRNGSGKSAILTALTVGLGGKASLTNRGNSVKSFIKAGKNSATIEITLRNAGMFGYQPKQYGEEITIIRHFTANGSSYRIKGATGQVVSTLAKEVQRICNYLGIQIDNPVCLLNQDTARNFLNSKDPQHKFLLFVRAMRLDELNEQYKIISSNWTIANRRFEEKNRMYTEFKKKCDALAKKMENAKSFANLGRQCKNLKLELMWTKIDVVKGEMQNHKEVVNQLEVESSTIQEKISDGEREKTAISQTMQTFQQQINDLQKSGEQQNSTQRRLMDSLGELKLSLNEKRREKRMILKEIAAKTGECNLLEREITTKNELCSQVEREKIKHLEDLKKIEKTLKDMEDLIETTKNERFQTCNSINRLKEEGKNLLAEIRQRDSQIETVKSKLHSLRSDGNTLAIYGQDMPRIVAAINAAKDKFVHLPRGPLGAYIKLKNKKWAVAVEGFLSAAILCGFTVDNNKDSQLLTQIFGAVNPRGRKPMIVTSKFLFKVHDVSRNVVQSVDDCISIYDALDVSDPVVANCLIDQTGLESVLLIPDTDTAIRLMSNERLVPRNCQQGITIQGDRYYPDPNYKTYASQYHTARYLQVSTADSINQFENKLDELKHQKTSFVSQHQSIETQHQEQNKKLQELEYKLGKFARARSKLADQHNELNSLIEPETHDIKHLENELSKLKATIEERNVTSTKIAEDLEKLKQEITVKEEELTKVTEIVRGYDDRIAALSQQENDQRSRCKDIDVNKRFSAKRLEEIKNRLRLARSDYLKIREDMEAKLQQAIELGEKPAKMRDVHTVTEELKTVEKVMSQIQSECVNLEELQKKHEEYTVIRSQTKELLVVMHNDLRELRLAASSSSNRIHLTQEYFIDGVDCSFRKALKLRQFQGSLHIDMNQKKLELTVIPQQGSQGATTVTNLSGGERTFSTVAFLYALWQCMEFPFYFLDEFDVFMDKVNRSRVIEILLYQAKINSKSQFVFLTPQDISFIKDKDVAIHRLDDPERSAVENKM